jgi:hypothetical protein
MPGAESSLPPASEVPGQDVSASFWVEDGELQRVELDLAQFLDEPAGSFVIRADITDAQEIEAPDDSVEVDLEELVASSGATPDQLFGAFTGVGGGSEVEAAAMAVGVDFQMYAEMEGVPPTVAHLPMVAEFYAGMAPPLELMAVGDRVQVTYAAEVACLTLPADYVSDATVVAGPC